MKSILVIGSKGFIGSHCVSYFRSAGFHITACDVQISDEKNYLFLGPPFDFNKLFSSHNYDYCINAAGSAHINYSFQFPEKDFELNVSLVINLLGAIKNNSPECKFINFSSAAVYGNPESLPIKESSKTNPLSPYGYHKLLSENLLYEYFKFFNLKTCSLRVFSAYGEGLKKQLFWDVYMKMKQGSSVTLFGTGNESRDFIYANDVIKMVSLIIENAQFEGEVYNIGSGKEIFIKDAVSIFMKEMSWKGDLIFSGEEKLGDPINWKADMKKLNSLGAISLTSLSDGLKNYAKWLKEGE